MNSITDALIPVLGLILVGFAIQRTDFLPYSFWPSAEKLTYFLLMPATLIHSMAAIITVQTCLSFFTLPLTICCCDECEELYLRT